MVLADGDLDGEVQGDEVQDGAVDGVVQDDAVDDVVQDDAAVEVVHRVQHNHNRYRDLWYVAGQIVCCFHQYLR